MSIPFLNYKRIKFLLFFFFTFMWPCSVTNFFIITPTRCTSFTNLFWHETLHVSDSSSVHRAGPRWSCSKAVYKPVWHIPLLSVQWINSWWWTEELSETCWVSCQNKFVKLVHLVGFIIKKPEWAPDPVWTLLRTEEPLARLSWDRTTFLNELHP